MRTEFIKSPGTKIIGPMAALGLLALTGCNQIDPLKRPYMWHEGEVNAHNIAAMAVNPGDLVRGRDTSRRQVITESEGARRLWSGQQLPLLGAGASGSSGGAGGGSSGGSGGASGGGAPAAGGGT
jgi:hypothetical protein